MPDRDGHREVMQCYDCKRSTSHWVVEPRPAPGHLAKYTNTMGQGVVQAVVHEDKWLCLGIKQPTTAAPPAPPPSGPSRFAAERARVLRELQELEEALVEKRRRATLLGLGPQDYAF